MHFRTTLLALLAAPSIVLASGVRTPAEVERMAHKKCSEMAEAIKYFLTLRLDGALLHQTLQGIEAAEVPAGMKQTMRMLAVEVERVEIPGMFSSPQERTRYIASSTNQAYLGCIDEGTKQ